MMPQASKQSKGNPKLHPQIEKVVFATIQLPHDVSATESTFSIFKNGKLPIQSGSPPNSRDQKIESCPEFEIKPHQVKIQFLKQKGVCFGCLKRGHGSKDCKRQMSCDICKLKHPSALHIGKEKNRNNEVTLRISC